MTAPNPLEAQIREDLQRDLKHFKYGHAKVSRIDFAAAWDEETLETLESFSSRFARLSALCL